MTAPSTHVQVTAETGGSDWVLACVCGWRATGATLAAVEYRHGEHVADEQDARRRERVVRRVSA